MTATSTRAEWSKVIFDKLTAAGVTPLELAPLLPHSRRLLVDALRRHVADEAVSYAHNHSALTLSLFISNPDAAEIEGLIPRLGVENVENLDAGYCLELKSPTLNTPMGPRLFPATQARNIIEPRERVPKVRKARLKMVTTESHKGTRFKSPHALKAGIDLPAWM